VKSNSVFVAFGIPISIPLALPFIFHGITKNNTAMLFAIAVVMAILSYLSVPYDTMDLVRYYSLYDVIQNLPFRQIVDLDEGNLFTNTFIKLLTLSGLNKQCLPLISNFISYCYFFQST
jgi:hypothetical protein